MATIQDHRESRNADMTAEGYVIATDKFMSGWGLAENGRSLVACPFVGWEEEDRVVRALEMRSEMRRVRSVGIKRSGLPAVRLRALDHLSIYPRGSFNSADAS